ncbi:MAG: ATP-binding protein [Gemmatimonadota bacterium]
MSTPPEPDSTSQPALPELSEASLARAVVETVRSPLLVLDEAMTVVHANPAFLSTFELEEPDAVGKPFFELSEGQWDKQRLRVTLGQALREHEEVRDLDLRLELWGLGLRDLVLSARRVRLEGAEQNLLLLCVDDLTEHRALERQTREYATKLERSNRDLQDFAHAASHDLQEPLRKVRTYAHRLRERLSDEVLDERSVGYLQRMDEAVERMQDRIDDLLQLARVGRAEPDARPVSLNDIVSGVLADLEVAIQETGARISVEPLPEVVADPSQLGILFQNLVANAIKFRKPGEAPSLRIRAREPSVDEHGTSVRRIVVEDDGIGFEQLYAERIFTPFQRLHGRNEYEGSGVGLALCRRIAEHHDGWITAEGTPGEGSRFTLALPLPHNPEKSV